MLGRRRQGADQAAEQEGLIVLEQHVAVRELYSSFPRRRSRSWARLVTPARSENLVTLANRTYEWIVWPAVRQGLQAFILLILDGSFESALPCLRHSSCALRRSDECPRF